MHVMLYVRYGCARDIAANRAALLTASAAEVVNPRA